MKFTILPGHIIFLLTLLVLCASCKGNETISHNNTADNISLKELPAALQVIPLSFDKLLKLYDELSDQQKIIALTQLLVQKHQDDKQREEVAYMLGRLLQSSDPKQAIQLFDLAHNYPPLKKRALWHQTEAAALLGKEKLVRQVLATLKSEAPDKNSAAAIDYALAQSYIRAHEINNAYHILNKIKTEFPQTNYSIGADYYLGSLAYNQQLFKEAREHFFQYLQASPAGHFSPDILLKLESLDHRNLWRANDSELVAMALAYYAVGQYKSSLSCWTKSGINKHWLHVSSCLVKLGQYPLAQQKFLQALGTASIDNQYLSIANAISSHLNRSRALNFWQQLQHTRFPYRDEILWNIAIRSNTNDAFRIYQNLLTYCPQSVHAPEAQWLLLWHKFNSAKKADFSAISALFYQAGIKYSHSQLAPRFYFWAGKIAEQINDKQHTRLYYQQALKLLPASYYGQRANVRLNFLNKNIVDDYFETKNYLVSTASPWQYPAPDKAINAIKDGGNLTLYELIYLKQYDEALAEQSGLTAELASWLEEKCGQPAVAINIASKCLEEKSCPATDLHRLQQYSFPFLYNHEIVSNCKRYGNVDSLLVQALVREESRYDPKAVSQTQALGLTQLMPTTANGMASSAGMKAINKERLFEPKLNLALGIAYLAYTLKTFNNNPLPAIAAYNAGVGTVKSFIANNKGRVCDPDQFVENFPFRETRDYMRKVFLSYHHYREIY